MAFTAPPRPHFLGLVHATCTLPTVPGQTSQGRAAVQNHRMRFASVETTREILVEQAPLGIGAAPLLTESTGSRGWLVRLSRLDDRRLIVLLEKVIQGLHDYRLKRHVEFKA